VRCLTRRERRKEKKGTHWSRRSDWGGPFLSLGGARWGGGGEGRYLLWWGGKGKKGGGLVSAHTEKRLIVIAAGSGLKKRHPRMNEKKGRHFLPYLQKRREGSRFRFLKKKRRNLCSEDLRSWKGKTSRGNDRTHAPRIPEREEIPSLLFGAPRHREKGGL